MYFDVSVSDYVDVNDVDETDVNIEEHYTREEKKLSNYISVLSGNV